MADTPGERRQYKRIRAPILVRPAGPLAWNLRPPVSDISAGGLRAYSDDEQPVGTKLDVELHFKEGKPAHVLVEVVWVQALPDGAPAKFDVGLRFLGIRPEDRKRIEDAEEA